MSYPTVFYQPGTSIAVAQAATITSLVQSRTVDESHIVSIGFAVQNLIVARITDDSNCASLTTTLANQLTAINSLKASRVADEASIVRLQSSVVALQAMSANLHDIDAYLYRTE